MAHANAGGHLEVPNVQALAQTWNGSGEQVPARYVGTEEAGGAEVVAAACRQGFFQLINHGVPDEVIRDVKRDIAEFFNLPLEAKMAHAKLPDGLEGYGQIFVFSETQKLDWSDMLYLMLRPVDSRDMRFWPVHPPSLRSPPPTPICFFDSLIMPSANLRLPPAADTCLEELRGQVFCGDGEGGVVLAPVHGGGHGRGAGAPAGDVRGPAADHEGDLLPAVPGGRRRDRPVAAHGRLRHDGAAPRQRRGLQIRRDDDGKWLAVEPLDGALIVSVGDIIEILSNGRYRSVEHRAVVNPDKERIAAAMFHQPRHSMMVEPLPELVKKDGGGAR